LGQIWTNPNVGFKRSLKNSQLKVKVEVGSKFEITFGVYGQKQFYIHSQK